MNDKKVAVIGAGPCGLAACKVLGDYGIDYECLEAGDDLGGIWNIECGAGGYRSLHTNTSTRSMAFSDFPFEAGYPAYPNAAQMTAYFRSYAEHFGVTENIRFRSPVISARPLSNGRWQIEQNNGTCREYASVIVATGQYAAPRSPHQDTPGEFAGEVLHVSEYLDAAGPIDIRGKRVVVVGLGTSGAEVAADLCNPDAPAGRAAQVVLAARSGRWVLPKIINGQPLDSRAPHPAAQPPILIRALPGKIGQWLARRTFSKMLRSHFDALGGATGLGLPEPTHEPWEERPTMSADFIPSLQAGRIDVRSGIQRFDGSTVYFTDGTHTVADAIFYATGYQLDFPFLNAETLGSTAPNLRLYQRIAHPVHDRLFFVGCAKAMCSLWPLAEQQSHWIARLMVGSFALPASKKRLATADLLSDSRPVMCAFYVEKLRRQAGGLTKQ